jgi:CelD/BcsL family acetyltransferase involved in cellulose biosynthesis
MSTTVERVALTDSRWSRFAEARPEATVFHRLEWSTLLAEAYGYEAFAVIATEGGQTIAGAPFLRIGGRRRASWSSLPFTDSCSPLGDPHGVERLVGSIKSLAADDGVSTVELRCAAGSGEGEAKTIGVNHILRLEAGADAIARLASPAHARNVRRARGEGVEVSMGTDPADIETFYELHVRTRRRQGVPVQPIRFFRMLHQRIIARGHGFVVVARLLKRPLAAAVFLTSGATLVYKFGASDEREWSHRPNDILFQTVIADACRRGFVSLDFGRSELEDVGLRRFKSSWGAVESDLRYTVIGGHRDRLVVRLGGALLAPLIRYSSPAVCRALGEAFYRYAA